MADIYLNETFSRKTQTEQDRMRWPYSTLHPQHTGSATGQRRRARPVADANVCASMESSRCGEWAFGGRSPGETHEQANVWCKWGSMLCGKADERHTWNSAGQHGTENETQLMALLSNHPARRHSTTPPPLQTHWHAHAELQYNLFHYLVWNTGGFF